MKIAVIGTGGVGGYFGGKLAKAGFDVTFIARGAHLKALTLNGITVKSILGDFNITNIKATEKITALKNPDLIIIATKAWQIKEIRNDIHKIIHPESVILPLQNGILATEELNESISHSHLLGGLCRIISMIESPGVINHLAIIPTIIFGELNKTKTNRLNTIKSMFDVADINSRISDNIEADLWRKFIGICVSGLLAVSRTTYGELRSLKETREMMTGLLREVYLLSGKAGINIEPDFVEKTIAAIDTFPYESTTSLSRDVWEGRPSEIDYQNGTVVKLAEKYQLEVPVNKFIYSCILPMEKKARALM